jgi:hypothetical protein
MALGLDEVATDMGLVGVEGAEGGGATDVF